MLRSAPRSKNANPNDAADPAVLRQSVLEVALELGVGTNNHVERWLFSGENIIEEDELEPPPPLSFTPTTAQDSPSPADVFPIPPPFEGRSSFPDTPPPSASKKSGRFGRFLRHDNHGATTGDESEGGYLSEITSKKEHMKQKQKEEKRMRKEVEKRRKQLEKEKKKKVVAETDYETDAGYRSAPATGSNKLRKDFKRRPQDVTTSAASARAGYETGNDTDASTKKKTRPKRNGFFRLGGHGGDTDGEEPPPLPTTIPFLPPVPLPIADKWSRATADALSLTVPNHDAPFSRPDSTVTIDSISSSSNKTITSLGTVRASPLSTTPSSGSSFALSTPTSSAGTTDARSTLSNSGSSTTGSRPSVSTTGTSLDNRLSFAVSMSSFSSGGGGRRQGRRASVGTNAGNDEDLAARDYFGAANSTAARNSPLFFVTQNDGDGLEDIDDLPPPTGPGALLRPSSPASSLGRSSRSPTAFFRRALGGGGPATGPVPNDAPAEGNSRRISLPNTSALSSRLRIPDVDAKAASMDEPSPHVKVTPPPAHAFRQHRDQAAAALAGAARSPSRNEAVSSSHVPSIVIAATTSSPSEQQRTTSPPPSSRSALARSPPTSTPGSTASPSTRASRPSSPLPSPRPSFHHEMPPPPSPPPTGPLPPPPPPGQAQAAVPGSPVRSVRSSSHLPQQQQQQSQSTQKAPVVPPTNMYVTLPEPTPEEMRAVSPTPGHGSGRRRGRGSEARVGSGASHGPPPPPPSLVNRGHHFGSSSQQHPQQTTTMATRRASSDRAGGVAVMGGPGSSAASAAAAQGLTHSQSLQHHYQHHQSPLTQHQHHQQQQHRYQQQQHYTQQPQQQQQQQRAGVSIPVQDRQHSQSHPYPQPRSASTSGSVPNAPVQYGKLQPAFQTQFQAHRRQPMVQPQPQPQQQQQQPEQAHHAESVSLSPPVRPQRPPRRQYQQDSASDAEHGGASGSSEGHGDHHHAYHLQRRQGPQQPAHSQVLPTINHHRYNAEDAEGAPEQRDRETVSRSVLDLGQALASRYESSASDKNADGDEVASLSEQDHTHGPRYVEDYYFNGPQQQQQQQPLSYHRATPDAPRSAESADISSVSGDHHDAEEEEQDADVSVEDEVLPPPRLRPRFSALAKKEGDGEEGDGDIRDDRASRGRTTMFTESIYSRSSLLDSETSGSVRENFVKRVRAMFEEEQGAVPPVPRLPAAYR